MTPGTDRTQYREVLASLVQQTQTRHPALNGRLTNATKLALLDDVDLHDDGTATVHSASDPTRHYRIVEGTCTCRDFEQAPEHLCQHRLAAGLVRKARELVTMAPAADGIGNADGTPAPLPQSCPEAAFSVTLKGLLDGQDALLTVRGQTAAEFTTNLQAIRGLLDPLTPPPATAPQGKEWCRVHGVSMQRHENAKGVWYSHYVDGKHCKGR